MIFSYSFKVTNREHGKVTGKYKDTRKYLLDLQNADIIVITAKNLGKLFETGDVEQYKRFYEEYY